MIIYFPSVSFASTGRRLSRWRKSRDTRDENASFRYKILMPGGYRFDLMRKLRPSNTYTANLLRISIIYNHLRLVPMRLDGTMAKCQRGEVTTPSTRPNYVIGHIVAGHRRGKGNSHTSVLMKAGVHDWAPTRRKSFPSSTYSVYSDMVMTMSRPSFGDIKPPIVTMPYIAYG